MKILIVCSGNSGKISPFILDQVEALKKFYEIKFDFYLIKGHGIIGYLRNLKNLTNKIKQFNPDIIHAHYGLSSLLANLQRKIPVITTYHGSDINNLKNRFFSQIASLLSNSNIFVNELHTKVIIGKRKMLVPCGVDSSIFSPNSNKKNNFNLRHKTSNILFSSNFKRQVKNYPLAKKAMQNINANLIELVGFNRKEVSELINIVDCVLLTSFSEGSPQIVKEAMACNIPVVSTDVGDVKWLFGDEPGYYLTSYDPQDVAEKIKLALDFKEKNGRTNGRQRIIDLGLDSETIANKIVNIYRNLTDENKSKNT
jgi:glycosyltransferase involved in cell wall biosynthesis